MIKYFPPAEVFLAKFPALDLSNPARGDKATENDEAVHLMIESIISGVGIDQMQYFETYPDIEEAVASGQLPSAAAHFSRYGYFERRVAIPNSFDKDWYLATYPDVGVAIADGEYPDAATHYIETGVREWRSPCEGCADEVVRWHQVLK